MASGTTPHYHNDMGDDEDTVCPYCSTHFRYDPKLGHGAARPEAAVWRDEAV